MSVARSYYNANVRRGTIVDMETEAVKKRETMVEIEDKLREGAFQDELRAARMCLSDTEGGRAAD